MAKPAPQHMGHAKHEHARSIRPSAIALAVAACFSGAAMANPTSPTVVHGTASFQQAGNILNITNSANAIINWGSFSISVGELTRFIQPSALSAVLNRVTGQDPSAILGALQSNGRVFLVNPNGIVFGAGAQIDVAGLVASTLNLSNEDFLNNRMRFTDGAGAGSIVNQGQITGGSVYLVGKAVSNDGLITSPNGEVILAAGNSVELVNPGTPNLRVEITAPDNEARNLGSISAEAGRIGIYAGLIHNSGTLNASSAVAEGGRILLKAKKDITLGSTSVIDASGQGGGEIIAFADNNMYVDGTLKASAPVSGDGGFIETSGKNRVNIADTATVTTSAAQGKTGIWLLDPTDFVIAGDGSGDAYGSTISGLLSSNNVVITSDGIIDGVSSGGPDYPEGGNIIVNDGITWSNSNSLTLTARRSVEVNEAITNSGNGALNLYAGWDGNGNAATPTLVPTKGDIVVNAPISVGSAIKMSAGNDISILNAVTATGRSDSYGGAASITLTGRQVFIDDMVVAQGQDGSFGSSGPGGDATVLITAGAGGVNISSSLYAYAGNGVYGGSAGGNAGIQITSSGDVRISSQVRAIGGDGAEGGNGGNGAVTLSAGLGGIAIESSGSLIADGGEGGYSYSTAGAGGNASVSLTSTGGITIDGGVNTNGGYGGYGSSSGAGGNGGAASVTATAGGSLTVEGSISSSGGDGGDNSYGGSVGMGGAASVLLSSTGPTNLSGAYVSASGGDGAEGGSGGAASVIINSTGNLAVVSGGVFSSGGDGSVSGGNALLRLQSGGSIQVEGGEGLYARGGSGSPADGNGGSAVVVLSSAGSTTLSDTGVWADGGYGNNNGGAAQVTVSSSGGITVNNAGLQASGGSGSNGQGGAASVGLFAQGNVQVEGGEGSAWGGSGGTAGGVAAVNVIAGGSIIVDNSAGLLEEGGEGLQGFGMSVYDNFFASGGYAYGGSVGAASVVLAAAGNVNLLNGAGVSSDVVGLGGANVILDNAYAYGYMGVQVDATGSLQLINSSELYSGQDAVINTGGGVQVDDSYVGAANDVFLKVGTAVNMSNGGVIEAGAPTTINLTFPLLTGGGFFVNGIEGVVFDELTGTGFMANGSPAVLGESLKIVYGGGNVLNIPTDALIVAMGESTKPPDPEKDKDVFEDIEEKKKKEAPVCR